MYISERYSEKVFNKQLEEAEERNFQNGDIIEIINCREVPYRYYKGIVADVDADSIKLYSLICDSDFVIIRTKGSKIVYELNGKRFKCKV